MKRIYLLLLIVTFPINLFCQQDSLIVKDTTHQLRLPIEAPDSTPSIIYNMPIYVPDSSMQHFEKIPYEDLMPQQTQHNHGEVFYIVEDMPTFNGGDPATEFRKYIARNLRYPEIAAKNGISGRVIVQFAVDRVGNVVDAVVVRNVDPALDKEAVRVVMSSPKWVPGKQRGKAVKVLFTFPINFEPQ
jgi:protein TonB